MKKIFVPDISYTDYPTFHSLKGSNLDGFVPTFLYRIAVKTEETQSGLCYASVSVKDRSHPKITAFVPFATPDLNVIRHVWQQLPHFSSLQLEKVWMLSNARTCSRAYPLDLGTINEEDALKRSLVHVLLHFFLEDSVQGSTPTLFSLGSDKAPLPSDMFLNRADFLRHAAEEIKGAESKYTT